MIETLQQVTGSFEESPYEINNGLCDEWAEEVSRRLKGKHFVEIWETVWGFSNTSHVFVRIDGKFRDAECMEGVEDHMELPIFAKLLAEGCKRQPVWLTDCNEDRPVPDNKREMTAEMVREYNEINGTENVFP